MKKNLFTADKNVITPNTATTQNNVMSLISYDDWNYWFKNNLKYIEKFKSIILLDKRMRQTRIPYGPGGCYIGKIFFTVEVLLKCWESIPIYNLTCDKCGERSVVYFWNGSPLSGSCCYWNQCLECEHNFALHNIAFRQFWKETATISMKCQKNDDGNFASCNEFIHFIERLKLAAN